VEAGQTRPLTLSRIEAVAKKVGKVPSAAEVYPSPVRITGVVFHNGWLQIDGHADFLGVPHVGFKGHLALDRIVLDYFAPIAARHGFTVAAGTVGAKGHVEYAPHIKIVDLEEIRIDGLKGDYAYHQRTARPAKDAAKATAEGAKEVSNKPGVLLKARRLSVNGATVGFVNEQVTPRYRVFFADTNLVFENSPTSSLGAPPPPGLPAGSWAAAPPRSARPSGPRPRVPTSTWTLGSRTPISRR
jgi:hypothetical protein